MADYLIDTNHLSPLVTQTHPLRSQILRQSRLGDSFTIAAPALTEFLFGIQMTPRFTQNVTEWAKLNVVFTYLGIERVDAEQAATLQTELHRHGKQLQTVDALITAVALRYHLILLTTDNDFQYVPGLQIEDWLQQ